MEEISSLFNWCDAASSLAAMPLDLWKGYAFPADCKLKMRLCRRILPAA